MQYCLTIGAAIGAGVEAATELGCSAYFEISSRSGSDGHVLRVFRTAARLAEEVARASVKSKRGLRHCSITLCRCF